MTTFMMAAAALAVVAAFAVCWPLVRRARRSEPGREAYDLRVYQEQLNEVDRDFARGVVNEQEAQAARLEIKRRMLVVLDRTGEPGASEQDSTGQIAAVEKTSRRWRLAAAILLGMPVASLGLYGVFGHPRHEDQPLAMRQSQQLQEATSGQPGEARSLEESVAQLASAMQKHPDDGRGWFLLGRAYMTLGRFPEAIDALNRAREIFKNDPDVDSIYAEALIAAADGEVTDEAREILQSVQALDPLSPQARFLLALDRAQHGDLAAAAQGWVDLLAITPANAPWRATVQEHLQRAADGLQVPVSSFHASEDAQRLAASLPSASPEPPNGAPPSDSAANPEGSATGGPSAADVEAAQQMTAEQRAEMINSMVDRLAARLKENPNDKAGWLRLAQAYRVLGRMDEAASAQARADALGNP